MLACSLVTSDDSFLPLCLFALLLPLTIPFCHSHFYPQVVPEYIHNPDLKYNQILVPTVDTVRSKWLLKLMTSIKQPILFVGEPGTSKTATVSSFLRELDQDSHVSISQRSRNQVWGLRFFARFFRISLMWMMMRVVLSDHFFTFCLCSLNFWAWSRESLDYISLGGVHFFTFPQLFNMLFCLLTGPQ